MYSWKKDRDVAREGMGGGVSPQVILITIFEIVLNLKLNVGAQKQQQPWQ